MALCALSLHILVARTPMVMRQRRKPTLSEALRASCECVARWCSLDSQDVWFLMAS